MATSNLGRSDIASWNGRNQNAILAYELGINVAGVDRLYELVTKDETGAEVMGVLTKPSERVRQQVLGLAFGWKQGMRSFDTYRGQHYQNLHFASQVPAATLEFFPVSLFYVASTKPTELSSASVQSGRIESCDLSGMRLSFIQAPRAVIENSQADNAKFTYGNLAAALIKNCEFYNSSFVSTVFGIGTDVPESGADVGIMANVGFKDCQLDDVHFGDVLMVSTKFSGCDIDDSRFNGQRLPEFIGTTITRSYLYWDGDTLSGNNICIFQDCTIQLGSLGQNVECLFSRCQFLPDANGHVHLRHDLKGSQFLYCTFGGPLQFLEDITLDGQTSAAPAGPIDLRGVSFEGSVWSDPLQAPTKADFITARDAGKILLDPTSVFTDGTEITAS